MPQKKIQPRMDTDAHGCLRGINGFLDCWIIGLPINPTIRQSVLSVFIRVHPWLNPIPLQIPLPQWPMTLARLPVRATCLPVHLVNLPARMARLPSDLGRLPAHLACLTIYMVNLPNDMECITLILIHLKIH